MGWYGIAFFPEIRYNGISNAHCQEGGGGSDATGGAGYLCKILQIRERASRDGFRRNLSARDGSYQKSVRPCSSSRNTFGRDRVQVFGPRAYREGVDELLEERGRKVPESKIFFLRGRCHREPSCRRRYGMGAYHRLSGEGAILRTSRGSHQGLRAHVAPAHVDHAVENPQSSFVPHVRIIYGHLFHCLRRQLLGVLQAARASSRATCIRVMGCRSSAESLEIRKGVEEAILSLLKGGEKKGKQSSACVRNTYTVAVDKESSLIVRRTNRASCPAISSPGTFY